MQNPNTSSTVENTAQSETNTPLVFKTGLKVYICDRKDIAKVTPAENIGVITFEYAPGVNYTKFGKYKLIEADMSALLERYHANHFAEMDSMAEKVIEAFKEMLDVDVLIIQCGSAEIRSIATAKAFYTAGDWFGGWYLYDQKKKDFVKVNEVPPRGSNILGRYSHQLMEALYED